MAIFLTSIDILDTGFLDVSTRTGQLATSGRVNSGSSLRLKSAQFEITSSGNLDKAISPGFNPANIKGNEKRALISINPTTFSLSVIINPKNTDTTNIWGINDMSLLPFLHKLPHTKGWKAIYYPVDNAAVDTGGNSSRGRSSQAIYQLGATDTSESQGDIATSNLMTIWTGIASATGKDLTDVNYIPVRFESCQITNTPNGNIQVTLSGVVTG